jgi:hypothetical protein
MRIYIKSLKFGYRLVLEKEMEAEPYIYKVYWVSKEEQEETVVVATQEIYDPSSKYLVKEENVTRTERVPAEKHSAGCLEPADGW